MRFCPRRLQSRTRAPFDSAGGTEIDLRDSGVDPAGSIVTLISSPVVHVASEAVQHRPRVVAAREELLKISDNESSATDIRISYRRKFPHSGCDVLTKQP